MSAVPVQYLTFMINLQCKIFLASILKNVNRNKKIID